jgi:hypothetical protein
MIAISLSAGEIGSYYLYSYSHNLFNVHSLNHLRVVIIIVYIIYTSTWFVNSIKVSSFDVTCFWLKEQIDEAIAISKYMPTVD